MLAKVILIFITLGLVCSEPIKRSITLPTDLSTLLSEKAELFEIAIKPETITSLVNIVKSIIGYKITALSLAGSSVNWLASNFVGITIGGIIALGVCKITGKCNLNYDETFSKLRSFITAERLEMAQNFFMNAINRYALEDEEEDIDFE